MQRTILSVVLTLILLGSLWPAGGSAEEPSRLKALLGQLQQEIGRLPQPELKEHLGRLQQAVQQGLNEVSIAPSAVTISPPGFSAFTSLSGLTDLRGFTFDFVSGFPCCSFFGFFVEQSLNRVSRLDFQTFPPAVVPFATGLSTPTDLLAAPCCSGPFGDFLYVTESGANRISQIDNTGAVIPFASFTSAPKRMAFSPDIGAFGTPAAPFLFVTLADGRIVKVDPAGTVSPCASGLIGPEGLAFGPGGSAFKNVLFVAESTGNKISKVSPACAVSPFASTGLNSPRTLALSPGGGWGPIDTLYVVNGTTKVDRVDKNGNVTLFASGFTQADTVRLPVNNFPFSRLSFFTMNISDAGAGTIEGIFVNFPFMFVRLTGCNPCRVGDIFTAILDAENRSPIALPVEIKAGFRLLDGTPVTFAPLLGNNKHFETVLPPGFVFSGVLATLAIPAIPPGGYCYEVSPVDPELPDFTFFRSSGCFTVLP